MAAAGRRIIVPYGTSKVPTASLAAIATGHPDALNVPGAPAVVIDTSVRRPLRAHAVEHPFTRPPVAQDLAHAAAQLAFLQAHLVGLCGAWERPRRAFVEAYFAAVDAALQANRDALLDALGPLAGLCELEHWGFSMPMPLPAAHVPATVPGAAPRADDFVQVDIAFWTGTELVAVIVAAGAVRPSRLHGLRRLEAAGVRLVRFEGRHLEPTTGTAMLERLGAPFARFWQSEPLPRSPFSGRGIGAPSRAP